MKCVYTLHLRQPKALVEVVLLEAGRFVGTIEDRRNLEVVSRPLGSRVYDRYEGSEYTQ